MIAVDRDVTRRPVGRRRADPVRTPRSSRAVHAVDVRSTGSSGETRSFTWGSYRADAPVPVLPRPGRPGQGATIASRDVRGCDGCRVHPSILEARGTSARPVVVGRLVVDRSAVRGVRLSGWPHARRPVRPVRFRPLDRRPAGTGRARARRRRPGRCHRCLPQRLARVEGARRLRAAAARARPRVRRCRRGDRGGVQRCRRRRPGHRPVRLRLRDLRRMPRRRRPRCAPPAAARASTCQGSYADSLVVPHADLNLVALPDAVDSRWRRRSAAGSAPRTTPCTPAAGSRQGSRSWSTAAAESGSPRSWSPSPPARTSSPSTSPRPRSNAPPPWAPTPC